MQSGYFAEAQPLFENLVRLDPKELRAHIALARIYGRRGKPELARKETQIVNQLEKEKASQSVPAAPGRPGASQQPPVPSPVPVRN